MEEHPETYFHSTRKQAIYLWAGLCLSMTLFFVQSQMIFIGQDPLPTSRLEWSLIGLGILTFLMGSLFFRNYVAIRQKRILKMPFKDRKQSLLIAFVLQFILFETLGLYGVLLSVWTQTAWKAFPFLVLAYVGFALSFPKKDKIEVFFRTAG